MPLLRGEMRRAAAGFPALGLSPSSSETVKDLTLGSWYSGSGPGEPCVPCWASCSRFAVLALWLSSSSWETRTPTQCQGGRSRVSCRAESSSSASSRERRWASCYAKWVTHSVLVLLTSHFLSWQCLGRVSLQPSDTTAVGKGEQLSLSPVMQNEHLRDRATSLLRDFIAC